MADSHLSLSKALRDDRLEEFIAQQETAGLPLGDREAFDRVVRAAVKEKRAARRTSGSPSGDGSTDSKTRRGKAAAYRG